MADALRQVGFSIVAHADLGKQGMERALRDFSRQADGAEVALIYYAGHGMEASGVNWLLPVDATLADERDLTFEAINLDTLLATVDGARGLRMVVLDACRNNPFVRSMRRSASTSRAVTRGLAEVEVTGTLVFYSARGGSLAQDGPAGGNSPFAVALARRIPEQGVDIRLLVSKVRDDVLAATGRIQEPFSYGSLPGTEMFLVPTSSAAVDLSDLCPFVAQLDAHARRRFLGWRGDDFVEIRGAKSWRASRVLRSASYCMVIEPNDELTSQLSCYWYAASSSEAEQLLQRIQDHVRRCPSVDRDWHGDPRIGSTSMAFAVQKGSGLHGVGLTAYLER